MDRNEPIGEITLDGLKVALRKESVDRNNIEAYALYEDVKSLSARRAWIEIYLKASPYSTYKSLSARRAWIEM